MKTKELKKSFYLLLFAMSFTACEKDDLPDPDPIESISGVFILNQGSWGLNNAGISYYDFETEQFRFDITNQSLGDIGQDMIVYGSKLYVSVSESGRISVFDLKSQVRVKDIDLKNGDQLRQPRFFTSYSGKIYVTTLDGNVVRIDTTSLSQDGITRVGLNPEGIAAVNGKLYVANSGGYNWPDYNNTLSIVDIAKFQEEKTITVGLNPLNVHADSYGNVYLAYRGNYDDIPGGFQRIDTRTNTVANVSIAANQDFIISGDSLYFYGVTYNPDYSTNNTFGIYNVKTEKLVTDRFITDGTSIGIPYGIGVNPDTKEVFISDTDYSNPGNVFIFGTDGKKKNTLKAGINACKFVFY
jgi:YVTN family beta-propeller protein